MFSLGWGENVGDDLFAWGRAPGVALSDYLWSSQLEVVVPCSSAGTETGREWLHSCGSQISEIPGVWASSTSTVLMPVWWHSTLTYTRINKSSHSPDCPLTCYVSLSLYVQAADPEPLILFSLLPKCYDCRCVQPHNVRHFSGIELLICLQENISVKHSQWKT